MLQVDIQPPAALYAPGIKKKTNIYSELRPPRFVDCQEDVWLSILDAQEEGTGITVKVNSAGQNMTENLQKSMVTALDHKLTVLLVFFMTIWGMRSTGRTAEPQQI